MIDSFEPRHEKTNILHNKDADQLHGNREADQRLCFHYIDSTIPLLSKSEISSLLPSSVIAQLGLCQTWLETSKTGFHSSNIKVKSVVKLLLHNMSRIIRKPAFAYEKTKT